MSQTGVLYDSLPMMRLGARDDDEEIVIAPDFSISAYMLEEYITIAVAYIAIPASLPESKRLADMPPLFRKRIRVIDDAEEIDAVNRILYPVLNELGVKERKDGKSQIFPKDMPQVTRSSLRLMHKTLLQLAVGFNHGLQIGIHPFNVQTAIRHLRKDLSNINCRAILAQLEGLLSVYDDINFESPRPPATSPIELVSLFDRLINDPSYLQMSEAITDLREPQKRAAALSKVREWGRKLVDNAIFAKGWDYIGKGIKAWSGAPIPEADTLATIMSGKQFPMLLNLRQARKRAVQSWQRTMSTIPPLSATGDEYEGVSWIVSGTPAKDWDGGEIFSFSLGTAGQLKNALEKFAQQASAPDCHSAALPGNQ
ncbi:hypothetical protein [Desulfobacter sp.]|uniref:hypothetical protein n=1 Tax=Desulfobacter sp. TaxID=2294 RepID=UPI000E8FDDA2|nr:hypothetical protein [Desulfobacter sp.]HBT88535.1 hypothetical protein [Desulfobacter sp.]